MGWNICSIMSDRKLIDKRKNNLNKSYTYLSREGTNGQ